MTSISMLMAGLAAVAALGCSADRGSEGMAAFTVTDSAGVEIIQNRGAPAEPILPLRETMRIGTVEGADELELYAVRDIAVAPDGEIFAALQIDAEVRVFGPDGAYRRTLGGKGEGPGEFNYVTWVGVFGDTLLAFDPDLYRMSVFSRTGELLDTWQIRAGGASVFPRARSAGGWIVELDDFRARVPYDLGIGGTDTARFAFVTSLSDALAANAAAAVPPWQALDVVIQYPRWTTWGVGAPGLVFGRNPLWEARERHAFDARGRLYIARGLRYAIDVFDSSGRQLRRITREHEPVPITDELVDRYRDALLAHYDTTSSTGEAGVDLVDALHQHIAVPRNEHLPALGAIVVSDEGAIWVERPDLADDPLLLEWSRAGTQPVRWDVFDADGRFAGMVEVAPRTTVHVVGRDWVIVTERDELDVQYIVRYAIGD